MAMHTEAHAYIAGWNACMAGVDGRYAQQFVKDVTGQFYFHDHTQYLMTKQIGQAWMAGWLDAMEADDDEEPEPECAGYGKR